MLIFQRIYVIWFDVDLKIVPLEFEVKVQVKGERNRSKKRKVGKSRA